jgi:glycosyltransferase involved in cell wall biosynthesis
MNLSVCIIAKNEEKNIRRCLESLKSYNFEIVVIDTGSTDDTEKIAQQYTDRVFHFQWKNDFSSARNFAISKSTKTYVMSMDCDECIDYIDVKKLQNLLVERKKQVGRIKIRNHLTKNGTGQENTEWINRIFSKELFHYEGCIHEQVTAMNGEEYETYQAPVVILHTGYDLPENERKQKAERNIKLLQQELQRLLIAFLQKQDAFVNVIDDVGLKNDDENNKRCVQRIFSMIEAGNDLAVKLQHEEQLPYILYQLGKGYYMAGDYREACTYFSCALSFDLNPKLEYVIDMVETYGYAMLNSDQADNALFFENIYEEFGNTADFQFLMGLIYMNNARFEDAVSEFLKATKHSASRNVGANSYMAFYNIGVIYECLGRADEAKRYYEMCGEYGPAEERLKGFCCSDEGSSVV